MEMNLRQYREAARIDRAGLAERLEVATRTVERWEAGTRKPSKAALAKAMAVCRATWYARRRRESGSTQGELADLIGTTQATVARWEAMERTPGTVMAWDAWANGVLAMERRKQFF